jgi:uncharacterized repeat protein (TIGR01451 family)
MSVARKGVWTALVAVVCAVGLFAGAGSALAETKTFTYTGAEQEFKVPAGVTSVNVVAVGSEGSPAQALRGVAGPGRGAEVSANLTVIPGHTLYVEVGGNVVGFGSVARGESFNGGGRGFGNNSMGGGASDVRTISIGGVSPGGEESLNSRLLVAAGGGGGGRAAGCASSGGGGGNAEEGGTLGPTCEGFTGGGGGGAGEAGKGGAGGQGYEEGSPESRLSGGGGELGKGGGATEGGGGGGGRFGGGGGGEEEATGVSAGGGGGGSNLVPEGGTHGLAAAGQAASVTFTYTPPATPPDLLLKNEASPSPVVSGNTLTYTLTVTNTGSETAKEVRLADLLPESAVFKSVSTTQGTCIRKVGPPKTPKPKDGSVFCKLGSLEGGKTATITITVTPTKPGTLNAKASVRASNVTPDANDEEAATTTVLGD